MLTAIALVLVVAAGVNGSAAGAPQKATLTVADASPMTIKGSGFRRGERVTVKVVGEGATYRKVVVANGFGRLTARWASTELPDCWPYTVTASGARGSSATLSRIRIPAPCGIVPQD